MGAHDFLPNELAKDLVRHVSIDIPLATIQAKTSGTPFDVGDALPANARLLGAEINVVVTVTGGSISACSATVANTGETAGSVLTTTDVFTATGRLRKAGTNPYHSRGGQQLQMVLTSTTDTLNHATTGHLTLDLYYTVQP